MNLTGNSSKNQPRKAMNANIRDSLIGMVSIMILEILFCMKLEIYKCFMIFWLKHQVAWFISIKYIVWEILEIQLTSLVKICSQLSEDNAEKIWAHWFLAKPKTIEAGGSGGALSPPGGPGQCLSERMYANPRTNLLFFL